MRRWSTLLAAAGLVGLVALSAQADDRLKVTGFMDNHIRAYQNLSPNDRNVTNAPFAIPGVNRDLDDDGTSDPDAFARNGRDDETELYARTRGRLFFNIEAFDNTKAVFGFEFDQTWGQRAQGSDGTGGAFDFGIDNNATELKWLYLDFKLPLLPVQMRAGGFSFNPTRLKDLTILTMDLGGVDALITINPQMKVLTWFAWTGEGFDGLHPAGDSGDDYATGITLQTTPVKGLDIDFIFAFQRIECLERNVDGTTEISTESCPQSTLRVGRVINTDVFGANLGASGNAAARENRFFLGIDGRWKYGPFTLSPTFFYQLGTRETVAGVNNTPGIDDLSINSFLLDIRAKYEVGPLAVEAKFAYTPGNKASDSLSGAAGDDEVNFFQHIAIDTVHRSTDWFEALGFNIDSTGSAFMTLNDSRSLRSNIGFDQFGLIHPAVKATFQATNKISVSGAFGLFWTDEDVGRPARLGGLAANTSTSATTGPTWNFRGRDSFIGFEADAGLLFKIYPKADLDFYFAYAATGPALDLVDTLGNVYNSEDIIMGGTRLLYRF